MILVLPSGNVSADLAVSEALIPQGTTQTITAELDDSGTAVAPATIAASVLVLDGTPQTVTLHDDGLNGDTTAGDHVFTGSIDTTGGCGTYRVQVTASGSTSEGNVTREQLDTYDVSVPGDAVRDPCNPDEDADGLTDAAELETYHTDPLSPDTDGDGYTDGAEVALAKDPLTFCAVMRADVNGSGNVNLLDLSAIAQWSNQAVPPAPSRIDQNGDAKINLLDLSAVAGNFNKTVAAACT
jgi:hypothetical protein